MGTVEIITIGGGQHVVAVLNAVAAWTGGGGFRGLLQVIMVIGLGYALLTMAMNLNWKVLYQWFISSTLMYACLIVPTTSVVVTDKVNPTTGNGAVANVPIGLAMIASVTSQANYWLTSTAETIFVEPNSLNMSSYGVVYPLRLMDASKQFMITEPNLKTNVESYINDCYLMAIMTNPATTTVTPLNQLVNGSLLTGLGPGSEARFVQWYDSANGVSTVSCNTAYNLMSSTLQNDARTELTKTARALYPDITDPTAAYNKLVADVPAVTTGMLGTSMQASDLFLQRSLTEAFMEARGNLGGAAGDTFATMRADAQARNTMSLTARSALVWVPVLDLVLTIVFYAMFPLIFPLMLLPGGGVQVLKGYVGGFFYLISWGSVSAVLHMFVISKAAGQMSAAATSGVGLTMANLAQLDGMNADSSALAGYLLMSVPVIAGGLAKGAMSLSSSAGAMLSPVSHGAEAASIERTTGNYSYGNVTANQFNTAPTHVDGHATSTWVNANGTSFTKAADGSTIYDNSRGISRLGFSANEVQSEMQSLSTTAAAFHNQADGFRSSAGASYQSAVSHANSKISGFSSHSGFESGKSSSFETSHRQDGGTGNRSENGDRVSSDSSLSHRESQNSVASSGTTYGNNASASAGLGVGGKGAFANAGVNSGMSVSNSKEQRSSNATDQSRSFQSGTGHNENVTTYKTGNDTWSFGETGVNRNGSFYRYDQLGESRQSLEKSFREAKSYEEQASFSDDQGRRLDKVVSDSQQNGWQINDDMSQVIASRYNTMANSEKYAGMGAPSLQNVAPTAHQSAVRSQIVSEIMKEYALQGSFEGESFRSQVEGGMKEARPVLAIPTASQMQHAGASLGPDPKGAGRPHSTGHLGADEEAAKAHVSGVVDGIKEDGASVRSSQNLIQGGALTHK